MIANRSLPVFVECCWKPDRPAIAQRAKAGVDVIEAWIDKLDRDDQAVENLSDAAVRTYVSAKLVAAKKRITGKKRVPFAFKELIVRQPNHFVTVLLHPVRKVRGFRRTFLVPEVARNKFLSDSEAGIGGEDHIRQLWPGRHEMNPITKAA